MVIIMYILRAMSNPESTNVSLSLTSSLVSKSCWMAAETNFLSRFSGSPLKSIGGSLILFTHSLWFMRHVCKVRVKEKHDKGPATMPLRSEMRLPHGKHRQVDDQFATWQAEQKRHCYLTPFGNPWHFTLPIEWWPIGQLASNFKFSQAQKWFNAKPEINIIPCHCGTMLLSLKILLFDWLRGEMWGPLISQ